MIRLAAICLAAGALAGCNVIPTIANVPKDCAAEFSAARCLAMADIVAAEAGRNRGDVALITYIPDPPPERQTLGGPPPIRIRVTFDDGAAHEARICGGIGGSLRPACSDEPELEALSVMGAFHDVPCAGEPPDGCASPLPTAEPDALANSDPLRIDQRAIDIDHAGHYEIELGQAALPNGVLSEAAFTFAEAWPTDVALRDATALLEVHSLERDGRPFDNIYSHGWRHGVERVAVILRFEVLWFEPGAELGIRDVIVR